MELRCLITQRWLRNSMGFNPSRAFRRRLQNSSATKASMRMQALAQRNSISTAHATMNCKLNKRASLFYRSLRLGSQEVLRVHLLTFDREAQCASLNCCRYQSHLKQSMSKQFRTLKNAFRRVKRAKKEKPLNQNRHHPKR